MLNPTFITGPVLSTVEHGSATIIGRMMNFSTFLASPKACLGVVDVRDVARAHILALTNEKTDGERILITHERPTWFGDIRDWLHEEFKNHGYLMSPLTVPNWVIKLYAKTNLDKQSTAVVHRLGPELRFSNKKVCSEHFLFHIIPYLVERTHVDDIHRAETFRYRYDVFYD